MLTFKELSQQYHITEELHKEIQNILDEPENEYRAHINKFSENKFNRVSKKVRDLSAEGADTGIADGKPKKGSSRAWVEHNTPKHITVDNVPTTHHTGVKIAIHGALDKYTGDPRLLGEMQNDQESDTYINDHYSGLREDSPNHYSTNEHPVIARVFDHHPDHHWLEMSKTDKLTAKKFKDLTKHPEHPKGLNFDDFHQALHNDYQAAHGHHSGKDEFDKMRTHPVYQNYQDYMNDSNMHPGDMRLQNMGVWKHPVTGTEHPVIRDSGFSTDIAKAYTEAQRKKNRAANFGW